MKYGTGIFLLVIGAILAFAVADRIEGVDLSMIGYICMGAGVLALIIGAIAGAQRSNTSHHEIVEHREDPPRV